MPNLSESQHQNLTYWGMAIIAIGLPLSIFMVSTGTLVLAVNWILKGEFKGRLKQFFSDRVSVSFTVVFSLFILGMFFTENLDQGFKELRIKLPILLLPLFLFTSPLPTAKRIKEILYLFVLGCVVGSVLGMLHYAGTTGETIIDKRALSSIISHIRFGLMIDLAIFILGYYLFTNWREWSVAEKLVTLATIIWLFFFLILMEAATGLVAFGVLFGLSLLRLLIQSPSIRLKAVVAILGMLITGASLLYVGNIYKNHIYHIPIDQLSLNVKTLNGRYYAHEKDVASRENGHRVWNFVCYQELESEWPKFSSVDFNGNDLKGQPIRFTATRYLTSKGLKKDSAGLSALTPVDIKNIERGCTNYKYTNKWGVSRRVAQAFWELEEYLNNDNANHSSLLQRWVYFKVGLAIVANHPVFGVGTGDIYTEYQQEYAVDDRGLEKQFQGISHNQFLTVAIVFGVVGFLIFCVALFYPLSVYYSDFLYLIFIGLILTSFMTDNTLDSQSGVTLFAFFSSILIIRKEVSSTSINT